MKSNILNYFFLYGGPCQALTNFLFLIKKAAIFFYQGGPCQALTKFFIFDEKAAIFFYQGGSCHAPEKKTFEAQQF